MHNLRLANYSPAERLNHLLPVDQLAKQLAAIHTAVMQILAGKADRVPLLESCTESLLSPITLTTDRAYLNPAHPFYTLIEAYQQNDPNSIKQHLSQLGKRISPYCELLQQCDVFIRVREAIELREEANGLLSIKLSALEDIYWLLDTLKISGTAPAFRSAVSQYNHDTGYTDNLREYSHYIRNLFNKHSRLLVNRLDLGYRQGASVTYEQFRTDVDYLLKLIPSNSAFKHLTGYIWKLEHGNDKGYHVHLLLFYDNAKRRSDYHIAKQIGELWQNEITLGRGLYFNCNAPEQKDKYSNCYLGVVHRGEQQKIDWIIEQGVKYLVKTDEYLRLIKPDNRRILGRGVLKAKK